MGSYSSMFDDEEEIGFVICASCGTRIKANRERCLRCEAPLVAWQKPELLPPWLQRIGGGTLIFGIVAVMILLFGAAMFVESRSTDDAARPLSSAGVPRAVQSLTLQGLRPHRRRSQQSNRWRPSTPLAVAASTFSGETFPACERATRSNSRRSQPIRSC